MSKITLQEPIKGDRPRADWGAGVVQAIHRLQPSGGAGTLVEESPSGTSVQAMPQWSAIRESLTQFPWGNRWAFGVEIAPDGVAHGNMIVSIYNPVLAIGQVMGTAATLALSFDPFPAGNLFGNHNVYLVVDWAEMPELSLTNLTNNIGDMLSLSLAPTLSDTQQAILLYALTQGSRLAVDYIHGMAWPQVWRPYAYAPDPEEE